MKRTYKKVLRRLAISKMRPIPKKGDINDRFDLLYWNLWRQYGFTPEKIKRMRLRGKVPSVCDFAWTKKVANAFYNHPYNKSFYDEMVRYWNNTCYLVWVLNAEPVLLDE